MNKERLVQDGLLHLLQVTAAELQQPGMEAAQGVEVIAPGRVAFS
jgi:hypothetical protein